MKSIDSIRENLDIPARGDRPSRERIRFVIGRCRGGGWIVSDRLGQVGGIFVSEAAARHFAFEESFRHPEQIEVLDRTFEFDLRKVA